MNLKYILLLVVTPLLLVSCFKQNSTDWVVKINKENITRDQIQNRFNNLPEQLRAQIPQDQQGQYVINQLIQDEILYQEAVKNTLNLNKDYQDYVKALTSQFEYQKKQGLIELYIKEKIDANIKISEQEVVEAFEKNKETVFNAYDEVTISHILVKTEKEANQVYNQLAKGQNFKNLAKKKSIDEGTAENGGRIPGKFNEKNISKEFFKPIFSLKYKGKFTKPVKSDAGYHIFRLDDKSKVKAKKYDEVKDFIKNQIFISKRNQEISTFLDSIKDNYKVEQNENLSTEENKDQQAQENS
ncbi:hypothetical protein CL657_02625 [bacterium]|nr:hypothetical protein [bacterium]|tara:strand:+ start:3506 stop:4402 length:897 start_codon:yes stop_codon:yes gene_type:complete